MTLDGWTPFWRHPTFWLLLGCLGQGLFTARFLFQWLATERSGATVVPRVFWWLSLSGGVAMLAYALSRRDPVVAFGQTVGLVVYARNLVIASRAEAGGVPHRRFPASPTAQDHERMRSRQARPQAPSLTAQARAERIQNQTR